MLLKGWEIEKQFESVSLAEVDRYATRPPLRKLMPQLISDSNGHQLLVESMIGKVRTDRRRWDFSHHISKYPFHMSWDAEMVKEIVRVERRMMEHYSEIYMRLNSSDSSVYLSLEDREYVLEGLKRLVRDEGMHYRLALTVSEAML